MRSRAERLSRALVRLYPPGWRKRYGAEMLALIDDAGSSWMHALDLAIGCADTWVRAAARRASGSKYPGPSMGALLVLVVSETAAFFSLTPPAALRVALQGAFSLLVILLGGSFFLLALLAFAGGFRSAWMQWFRMIRGSQPPAAVPQPLTDLTPSPRQVRALSAVIVVVSIGASLTQTDLKVVSPFRIPVPVMTYWMLMHVRSWLWAVHALASMRHRR